MCKKSASCSEFEHCLHSWNSAAERPAADAAAVWVGIPGLLYHAVVESLKPLGIEIKNQISHLNDVKLNAAYLKDTKLLLIDCGNSYDVEGCAQTLRDLYAPGSCLKVVLLIDDRSTIADLSLGQHADLIVKYGASMKQFADAINLLLGEVVFFPMKRPFAALLRPQAHQKSFQPQTINMAEAPHLPHCLSGREVRVLRSLSAGHSNKVIATSLSIKESTVKIHVKSILRKINAGNRTQAAVWASENLELVELSTPTAPQCMD